MGRNDTALSALRLSTRPSSSRCPWSMRWSPSVRAGCAARLINLGVSAESLPTLAAPPAGSARRTALNSRCQCFQGSASNKNADLPPEGWVPRWEFWPRGGLDDGVSDHDHHGGTDAGRGCWLCCWGFPRGTGQAQASPTRPRSNHLNALVTSTSASKSFLPTCIGGIARSVHPCVENLRRSPPPTAPPTEEGVASD